MQSSSSRPSVPDLRMDGGSTSPVGPGADDNGGFGDTTGFDALPAGLAAAVLDCAQPLYVCAPDGRLLYANAGYRALVEALGQGLQPLVAVDTALQAIRPEARGGEGVRHDIPPYVSEHRLPLGDELWVCRAEHTPIRDDSGQLLAVVTILVRQGGGRSEEAVTQLHDRFEDVSRLATDWIWETDRDFRFSYISPRVTVLLGYHPVELMGRDWQELVRAGDIFAAEDIARRLPAFHQKEVVFAHRDGSSRCFRVSAVPRFDPDSGRYLGYRGTAQDIGELKAREQAVVTARTQAEQASRAKTQFLAQMSHELRTPLNAIIGFSEILRDQPFDPKDRRVYSDYAGDILRSARELLEMIDDVLDIAKIETGTLELEETECDPNRLAEEAVQLTAGQAEQAGVTVSLQLLERPPGLRGDEAKLRQALVNLVAHAVSATGDGGHVGLLVQHRADGGLAFVVADDGCGLSPAAVEAALTPFGQSDSTVARQVAGTGLGVPLAKATLELHGGDLTISSTEGMGTTVTAVLPAARIASLD